MSKLALMGGNAVFAQPLPYYEEIWPPIDATTAQKLQDVYASRRWSAFNHALEGSFAEEFAAYHGAQHAIFMMNGTVTLECALAALGVGPGDEVIVPPLTWHATAMAVRYVGATPVFVDIEPETLCIDPQKIRAAICERTKAIIPVHTYSALADMDSIMEIAKQHDLRVIEDAAHVPGAIWGGKGIGSIGDVGSFSFQHSKSMSSAEGGMCITNDERIAERIYRMKHIGYTFGEKPKQAKSGPPPGLICHNYRATAFQAVILQEQLKTLGNRLERYTEAANYLERRLKQSTKIRFQKPGRKTERQGRFHWIMLFDHPDYADVPLAVIKSALEAEGMVLYVQDVPVYRSKLFNVDPKEYRVDQPCSVTEHTNARGLLMLHAYLGLDQSQLEKIADAIEKVVGNVDALRAYAGGSEVAAQAR